MTGDLLSRFAAMERGAALLEAAALVPVRGSMADYAALAAHHYRARRPGTVTRVLALRDPRPSVVGRYVQRRVERVAVAGGTGVAGVAGVAGVLVESMPALRCAMREWAMGDRYGSWLSGGERAKLLAAEVRCISRVVIEPRWRGLGLAVRLVQWALNTAQTPVTEALAAMGRVNPFFERAGMTAYPRPTHETDARLIAAMHRVGVEVVDLASRARVEARLAALATGEQRWFERELLRWWRSGAGRCQGGGDVGAAIEAARDRLVCQPIYYLRARVGKPPLVAEVSRTGRD